MSSEQSSKSGRRETLSALVDGEAAKEGVAQACAAWREDAELRQTWHAYQLIGDVLRSDDLAGDPARDEQFLQRLRARLADEPVVLAPQPLEKVSLSAGRTARRWRTGVAVAAGFVAVAGVLVALQVPSTETSSPVARAPSAIVPATAVVPAAGPAAAESATLVTDGQVIRDARLDRYLAAHQRFAGASALGVPSSFLRSATSDAAQR